MEWDEAHGMAMMLIEASIFEEGHPARPHLAWTGQGMYGGRDPFIEHLGNLLVDAGRSGCAVSKLHVESTAVLILHHLNKCHSRSLCKPSKDQGRLHHVQEFMHANLANDLSIVTLARIAHMSPFHFSRLFKVSFGLTPHQYVLNERIGMAKRLLTGSLLSIVEVAQDCGFATQAHLTTAFRMHVGFTPKQFRAAMSPNKLQRATFENK
jgi:AraC family transcriptional regulator